MWVGRFANGHRSSCACFAVYQHPTDEIRRYHSLMSEMAIYRQLRLGHWLRICNVEIRHASDV
jgi:hypothetical protein